MEMKQKSDIVKTVEQKKVEQKYPNCNTIERTNNDTAHTHIHVVVSSCQSSLQPRRRVRERE